MVLLCLASKANAIYLLYDHMKLFIYGLNMILRLGLIAPVLELVALLVFIFIRDWF